jgi:hypothetical protein
VTAQRQQQVLAFLRDVEGMGLTWKEYAEMARLHHGQASGVLSVLHKAGRIARLDEVRNRCKVYVLPEYVNERATEQHGQTSTTRLLDDMAEYLATLDDLTTGIMSAREQTQMVALLRRYAEHRG